jgi:hypothetical protein
LRAVIKISLLKLNELITMNLTNRNNYKSIVIEMSFCLPFRIGLEIIYNQVLVGIMLGNIAGSGEGI